MSSAGSRKTDDEYLALVLAEGDWKEADNPNTGGKYYYHKKTRESVKSLKSVIDQRRREDEAKEKLKSQQDALKTLEEKKRLSNSTSGENLNHTASTAGSFSERAAAFQPASFGERRFGSNAAKNNISINNNSSNTTPTTTTLGNSASQQNDGQLRATSGISGAIGGRALGPNHIGGNVGALQNKTDVGNTHSVNTIASAPVVASATVVDLPLPKPAFLPDKAALEAAALAGRDLTALQQKGGSEESKKGEAGDDEGNSAQAPQWLKTEAYNGEVLYLNTATGETTGDLGLYLQIQHMLNATESIGNHHHGAHTHTHHRAHHGNDSGTVGADTNSGGSGGKENGGQSNANDNTNDVKRKGHLLADRVELEDWTAVMINSPMKEEAAVRLIDALADKRNATRATDYEGHHHLPEKTSVRAGMLESHALGNNKSRAEDSALLDKGQLVSRYTKEELAEMLMETRKTLQSSRDELSRARIDLSDKDKAITRLQEAVYYGGSSGADSRTGGGRYALSQLLPNISSDLAVTSQNDNRTSSSYVNESSSASANPSLHARHSTHASRTYHPPGTSFVSMASAAHSNERSFSPSLTPTADYLANRSAKGRPPGTISGVLAQLEPAGKNGAYTSSPATASSFLSNYVFDSTLLSNTTHTTQIGHPANRNRHSTAPADGGERTERQRLLLLVEDAAVRIDKLEGVIVELQRHNRTLREALNNANVTRHIENDCGVCEVLDPWKRLVIGAIGGKESYAKSRVDLAERSVPDTRSLYCLEGLPAKSQYHYPHPSPLLNSRTDFTSGDDERRGGGQEGVESDTSLKPSNAFRLQLSRGDAGAVVPHRSPHHLATQSNQVSFGGGAAISARVVGSSPYRGVGGRPSSLLGVGYLTHEGRERGGDGDQDWAHAAAAAPFQRTLLSTSTNSGANSVPPPSTFMAQADHAARLRYLR